MIESTIELELVLVEKESDQDKIDKLHKIIVNSDFEKKIYQYIEISKRQDKILKKINPYLNRRQPDDKSLIQDD